MTPISLWRIAKETPAYQAIDLTGGGAKSVGGRWSSMGKAVVYTSSSIALATLETLVHLGDSINARNRFLVKIKVPQEVWQAALQIDYPTLDPTWACEPPGAHSATIGDHWLEAKTSALLKVPSVVIHEEFNVLINPAHPAVSQISATVIRQFVYDPRF